MFNDTPAQKQIGYCVSKYYIKKIKQKTKQKSTTTTTTHPPTKDNNQLLYDVSYTHSVSYNLFMRPNSFSFSLADPKHF